MQRWRWLALGAAITFIALFTLTPGSPLPFRVLAQLLDPWASGRMVALVLNVLLFFPLGIVIGCHRRPWWLLAAVGFSVAIEATQVVLPDRNPMISDVVANGLGAVLGYLAVVVAVPSRRRAPSGASTRDTVQEQPGS